MNIFFNLPAYIAAFYFKIIKKTSLSQTFSFFNDRIRYAEIIYTWLAIMDSKAFKNDVRIESCLKFSEFCNHQTLQNKNV